MAETEKNGSLELAVLEYEDVDELAAIMKRSFDCDSMKHLEKTGGPPGYENGDFIRKWCFIKGASSFKILWNGSIIGSITVFINPATNHNHMGNFFIEPELHGQGIGAGVWKQIEERYPQTRRWSTETIWYSTYNHYFYVVKCGFQIIRIDHPHNNPQAQYHMEKVMN